MNEALASVGLLALTIGALLVTRSRRMMTKIGIEAGLLLGIGAFLLHEGTSPLPRMSAAHLGLADAWLRALAVIWWLIAARLIVNATALARGRDPKSSQARLFTDLSAGVIYITAVLIILNSVLDLNIAGLVATSGVIAIILGLALQNTLADVFAGIAVGLEQPFHLGDRVSVGDNIEGVVVQLNWRSVRIETDDASLATIPNSLVAKAQLVNQSVPSRRRAGSVEVSIPTTVTSETIIELVRQATLLTPALLATPAPSITIRRSGMTSCAYAVRFFVADTPQLAGAKSNLLRQIRRQLRHAGIIRPAPMTTPELLGSLVLFEALSADELRTLSNALVVHAVEPGDVLFKQGDPADSIFVVAAGVMEISRDLDDGRIDPLGRIGPGEYVGEIGLITSAPRAFALKALTHGRVLEAPGVSLKRLLHSNRALNAAMERSVRRGLAQLDRDDAAREVHPAEQTADLLDRIRAFFHV